MEELDVFELELIAIGRSRFEYNGQSYTCWARDEGFVCIVGTDMIRGPRLADVVMRMTELKKQTMMNNLKKAAAKREPGGR